MRDDWNRPDVPAAPGVKLIDPNLILMYKIKVIISPKQYFSGCKFYKEETALFESALGRETSALLSSRAFKALSMDGES